MPNPRKAVVFDIDGTLVDSVPWHEEALNRSLLEMGYKAVEDLSSIRGKTTEAKLHLLASQGNINSRDIPAIIDRKQDHLEQVIREQTFRIDFSNILSFYKIITGAGIRYGWATQSNKQAAELILNAIGSRGSCPLITKEDVHRTKPDPECYFLAMSRLESIPTTTVIIEDSPAGVAAAKSSGAQVIQVSGPDDINWSLYQHVLHLFS